MSANAFQIRSKVVRSKNEEVFTTSRFSFLSLSVAIIVVLAGFLPLSQDRSEIFYSVPTVIIRFGHFVFG